jgi:Bacterial DNA-binding protein
MGSPPQKNLARINKPALFLIDPALAFRIKRILDELNALVVSELKTIGSIRLGGFGIFRKRMIEARLGHNPATGDLMKWAGSPGGCQSENTERLSGRAEHPNGAVVSNPLGVFGK